MDLLKVKEMNNSGIGNGFNLYLETEKKIASFLKTFEEDHMTWLEEIMLEARKTFSRRSLTLLPKTPSNAKRNRRIRPNSDDTEESSTDSPPAKKRVHRKSLDSEAETSQDNASKRPTRSTRASTQRPTQEKCKRTTRGKQPKTVSIMENNEESFSENKESISAIATDLPEKDNRVKKLIDHHEKIISESSDEDFHSPKRLRKYMKNELDTVPEAKPQSIEEQIIEPVEQKCVSEKSAEESIDIPCKKSCSSSEESDVFKESVQMPLSDHESIAATTSNDEDHAPESEDAPKIDEPSQNECEEQSSAAESKFSSSSDELSGKEIINETKEEVSMEEDSLNEGANALAQTSFNKVRMSISMSKSKKRSSLSKRRLSRDSRQSLRTSKRLSILAKNIKMESCDEDETDGRRQTRSSLSKRRLSNGSSAKKSVRRSLNASKRLSVSLQKSILESCQESQSSDASNAEDVVELVKKPVEVADGGKNNSGESHESSEDFTLANEATPELKKKSTRTKQLEPIANVNEADQPTSNEEVDTSDEGKPSIDSEKESSKKTTRTRTKLRRNKKTILQNEGTAKEEKEPEQIERKKSGIKNKRASQFDDDVNKKVKKLRLSHDEKDETIDGNVVASQSNVSEQFDDSLEPSSSEEVKAQSVPKRKSRRRTQDSDSDEGVTVTVTKNRSTEQEAQETQQAAVSSEDSCDEEVTDKTPSPKCPAEKVIRPQPQSFLHRKKEEGLLPTNSSGIITSFIKRNTPKKKTTKERQEEIKAQIREKQKKEEEIRKKLQQERKNKLEEQKRKREDRARKAAEARERRILQQNEKRIKLEEFYEHKQALTEKQKEEKKREEMQKKKLMTKKRLEAEERRRIEEQNRKQKLKQQEEEEKRYKEMMTRKKEFEEQERLQKQEEWRLQQELRKADQEKQRLEEAKRRRELEIENEREQQRIKEQKEKERREIERVRIQEAELREREKKAREEAEQQRIIEAERLRREQDRIKERENLKQMMLKEKQQMEEMPKPKLPLTTNSTALNTTVTKEPDMKSPQSYDITPQRIHKPSTEENYCIDDINSDDSTDDEEHPRKKIPSWAQGASLRAHLIHQIRFPVDLDKIFGAIEPPDLTLVFQKKRARYLKRTSSAVWNSPIFNKY